MRKLFLFFLVFVPLAVDGQRAPFSERAWSRIEPIYRAILEHPFNRGLADGTLRRDRYCFYEQQDSLYLAAFANDLDVLAERVDGARPRRHLHALANACRSERHRLCDENELGDEPQMAPVTRQYTILLAGVSERGTTGELAAALLPCFWIYQRLADDLVPAVDPHSPYQSWVRAYRSNRYRRQVAFMIRLVDQLAEEQTVGERVRMLTVFERAAEMEWRFWEQAYAR